MTRTPQQDERGAVAVMVAILAVVLFGVAALAVDLGNGWARKERIQTQTDVAILAAGGLLPATDAAGRTAVAQQVATYLNKDANAVAGQGSGSPFTSALLLDGNQSNGEVVFSPDGERATLVSPPATVDFGFAAVLGAESVDVTSRASVQVFTAPGGSDTVVPFWLPDGCPYGSVEIDTSNGGGNGNGGGGGSTQTGSGVQDGATKVFNSTAQPDTANQYTDNVVIRFRVTGVSQLNKNKTPVVLFQHRTQTGVKHDISGTWTNTTGNQNWEFQITIGSGNVTALSSQWRYQTLVHNRYSYIENFNVQPGTAPAPTVVAGNCPGTARGQFGQLESPRLNGPTQKKARFAMNIAEGLDHKLTIAENHAFSASCSNPAAAGEQLDNVSRNDNNCIDADTGNDGPGVFDGFVGGVSGVPGRLAASRGQTKSGCNNGNTTFGGTLINNDLLTCYLTGTYTLADLMRADASPEMLDPSILDSPRLVSLPIVYGDGRGSHDWQPIKRFVPAFITDQTTTSAATAGNGLVCNGNGTCNSLSKVVAFTFNPAALPTREDTPVVGYDPALGTTVFRLVE